MTSRPSVDIVVPFAGSSEALARLGGMLRRLELQPGDTVVIVDNARTSIDRGDDLVHEGIEVVPAPEVQSSYFARNRGAERGTNDWLVFLDADVEPEPDLIEHYFSEPVEEKTAVLVGAVHDEHPAEGRAQPPAIRYAYLKAFLDQEGTMADERWAYAKTANCAMRRVAFEAVGGFREDIRSGGDAEICFRLRSNGWRLVSRRRASVVHRSRPTLRSFLRQNAKHGSGSEWLDRQYPGFSPRSRWSGLVYWSIRRLIAGTLAAMRRDRDGAILGYFDAGRGWAFQLGRLFPNTVKSRE